MCGRIVAVDSAAEHRDRVTVCIECAAMRLSVDPACETTHDHDAGRRKLAAEHPRNLRTVR